MKFFKIIEAGVLLLFASLEKTQGTPGGSVIVRLYYLENPDGTICNPCDYQLSIWVTCDGKTTDSSCLYGEAKTAMFYNKSTIIFSQDLGNQTYNPLKYNFTLFQGNLGIHILAANPTTRSKIADYRLHQPTYPASYGKKKWTNATLHDTGKSKSKIKLSYQIYCKEHYYGPSCSVACFPGPNYKCNQHSGIKECINGYIGPNCTCKPGHTYNCDPTGKRICYRPWYGLECDVICQPRNDKWSGYTCDTKSGRKICLGGWYGPECNETTSVMSRPLPSYSLNYTTTPSEKARLKTVANSEHNVLTPIRSTSRTPPLMTSANITSSTKTKFMTSSHLPSYAFLTISGSQIPRNSSPSEDGYPRTTILITNYPENSSNVAEFLEKTNNSSGVTMDRTVISEDRTREAIEETSELEDISVDRTRQSGSTQKTAGPGTTTWIRRDTYHYEHKTEPLSIITTSTVLHKGRESTGTIIPRIERRWSSDWLTSTPPRYTTFRPEAPKTRSAEKLWWILLVPFIVSILLMIAGIYRKKNRKRFQISPHYEASMQDMEELKEPNDVNNKSVYNKQETENANRKSSQKDLETIWKVMSTFHE